MPGTSTVLSTGKTVSIALPPPHDDFSKLVVQKFSELDADSDGFVSKDEVNRALQDPKFTGDEAAMIATLKAVLGDLEELADDEAGWENDGVTLADVTAYDRLREAEPKNKMIVRVQNRFQHAKAKIAARSNNLFDGDPDVMNIRQGSIGNCWFLVAIVAIGLRDKAEIRNLVKAGKGKDEFVVNFPGVEDEITVSKPTDAELAIFALSNGLWLPLLEKSYGAAVNRDALFFVDSSDIDAVDGGGFIGKGIEIMTGNSTDTDFLSGTLESTTREKVEAAIANKKIMTAGVRKNFFGESQRENGLPMGHAYTVMGYDASKDTLSLRNPWGHKGLSFGEVFEQSLTEFDSNFSLIAYEE